MGHVERRDGRWCIAERGRGRRRDGDESGPALTSYGSTRKRTLLESGPLRVTIMVHEAVVRCVHWLASDRPDHRTLGEKHRVFYWHLEGAFYRLGLYSTNSSGNCCFNAAIFGRSQTWI